MRVLTTIDMRSAGGMYDRGPLKAGSSAFAPSTSLLLNPAACSTDSTFLVSRFLAALSSLSFGSSSESDADAGAERFFSAEFDDDAGAEASAAGFFAALEAMSLEGYTPDLPKKNQRERLKLLEWIYGTVEQDKLIDLSQNV